MNKYIEQEYKRIVSGKGYLEIPDWTVIQLTGEDRATFFHGFCTADIKGMTQGQVREAFVLNGKGRTIGHLNVLCLPESLLLIGPGGQAAELMSHLDMYIIRDDVQLLDQSSALRSFLIASEPSPEIIDSLFGVSLEEGSCCVGNSGEMPFRLARAAFAGPCFWLGVSAENADEWVRSLDEMGISQVSQDALEIFRLEHGTPWYARETTSLNLPQELNRDDLTISFTKGCYLGQEVVARIDSLGRVNRLLVQMEFKDVEPLPGQDLVHDGKKVGKVTSVASLVGRPGWKAMAFVKRELAKEGSLIGDGMVV